MDEITNVTRTYVDEPFFSEFKVLVSHSKRATCGPFSDHEFDKKSQYSYGDAKDIVGSVLRKCCLFMSALNHREQFLILDLSK